MIDRTSLANPTHDSDYQMDSQYTAREGHKEKDAHLGIATIF